MDYKRLYLKLFNTITDVIKELEKAQIDAESVIMEEPIIKEKHEDE